MSVRQAVFSESAERWPHASRSSSLINVSIIIADSQIRILASHGVSARLNDDYREKGWMDAKHLNICPVSLDAQSCILRSHISPASAPEHGQHGVVAFLSVRARRE